MKKYRIHVIQNSHTDLGYTHRQEYIYRAHARYLDKVIKLATEQKSFRWTMENFWMFENYQKWAQPQQVEQLKSLINSGQIELTANYLNLLSIVDIEAYQQKISTLKQAFPHVEVAIQQDVNTFQLSQAKVLANHDIKYLYTSIHTHHGMTVGAGKQRGFIWKLDQNKQIVVWAGEHYMLGNEMFMHHDAPNKYTFKDQVATYYDSSFDQGMARLEAYLDLLDQEDYPYTVVPVVLSGTTIDNSPPNANVLKGVAKLNEKIGARAEIFTSSLTDFFQELMTQKDQLPTFQGAWPAWWVDGVISTPEAVRQYREAQTLYHNIKIYQQQHNTLDQTMIAKLEHNLLLFAEHTWGSWSSQHDPFANGNQLLLARKIAFATKASQLAWTLWDEIKEKLGYNIIKVAEKKSYQVINIHNQPLEQVVALDLPRYNQDQLTINRFWQTYDGFELIDEATGQKIPATISPKMGLDDNINSSIEHGQVLLAHVKLGPKAKINLQLKRIQQPFKAETSSFMPLAIDNANDINVQNTKHCAYLKNGIENSRYVIKWNHKGINFIYDKIKQVHLLQKHKSIRPIHIVSPNDARHDFGRNRQGPSSQISFGQMMSHRVIKNQDNIQVVQLIFAVNGATKALLNLRLTNFENNKLRLQFIVHKTGTQDAENLYLDLPFRAQTLHVNDGTEFFQIGKEQLPYTNLDYFATKKVVFANRDYQVGINMQDTPLLQVGPLTFKQRFLMGINEGESKQKYSSLVWLMSNYWETNYKGTLEGAYSFAWDISVSKNEMFAPQQQDKKLVAFKDWSSS